MNPLESIIQPIRIEFEDFNEAFTQKVDSQNPLLANVMDYIQNKRGKQIRPILILLAAKLCGKISPKTIKTAVALELLHTASLIHDDVVDSTSQRRGNASINAKWNNKVAILVGDYLLSQALETAAELRNLHILQVISNIGKSLSSGELLQLFGVSNKDISEEDYFKIIQQKTAQLFAACTESAAFSVGAPAAKATKIRQFGEELGICFQLKDDWFDFSDSRQLGKPTMNDVRDGKITLPLIIALKNAPKNRCTDVRYIINHRNFSEVNLANIKQFVQQYGGMEYTIMQMEQHQKSALNVLATFPDSPTKTALTNLLAYTVSREM